MRPRSTALRSVGGLQSALCRRAKLAYMSAMIEQGSLSLRRILVVAAFAALAAAVVAVGASSQEADAARAKQLGKTRHTPQPNCPTAKRYRGPDAPPAPTRKSCQVLARVTGFQVKGDGRGALFQMPRRGKIVAWSVDLSRPTKEERRVLGGLTGTSKLGEGPFAQLAVLKRLGGGNKYKLTKETPRVKLHPYLGRTPVFTLEHPLTVKRGRIIGITTPTWAPMLAAGRGSPSDKWRASRNRGECSGTRRNPNLVINTTRAHKKVGSTRRYGCRYEARLTYWAYIARR
jgi:hypothetical protein